jgi:shikimate kinase
MPGAGKSTVGIILAKIMSMEFIDTDVLIQINCQQTLQQIMDRSGYLNLRKIEENEILKLNIEHHVIATGGSAVYSPKAVDHLRSMSTILFLKVDFEEIERRIHNFASRGIAKPENQTFKELFEERQILYNRYADLIFDCNNGSQEEIAERISAALREKKEKSERRQS